MQAYPLPEPFLQRLDLLSQRLADRAVGLDGQSHVGSKRKVIDLPGGQPFDGLTLHSATRLTHQDALDR